MSRASIASAKARQKTLPRRMRVGDPRTQFIAVRCTVTERAAIAERAAASGLAIGAFLRAQALGNPGPRAVRRPPIERQELARLLGHVGKVGSNIDQLAYAFNRSGTVPGVSQLLAIRRDVSQMREALIKALGHGH